MNKCLTIFKCCFFGSKPFCIINMVSYKHVGFMGKCLGPNNLNWDDTLNGWVPLYINVAVHSTH